MDPQDLENINATLDQEASLREQIRDQVHELDKKSRTVVGLLNKIHSTPSSEVPKLLDSVRPVLSSCREPIAAIAGLVPPNEFWKYRGSWTISVQTIVFAASLTEYLSNETLITLPRLQEMLDVKEEWKDRFAIVTEDYLHGLISLVNELSRLAVNSVTLGNFQQPMKISLFVKELFAGFTLLNLKNDTLRRRFDSLKYDIKKIEEVVYDVSLRKLAAPSSESSGRGPI